MSDFNSSLPVRTEQNGDVVAQLVDGTITTQKLAIDASGKISVKLDDGTGTAITSQANGAQRALDVGINVSGVQVDPRSIRALTSADVVTARLDDGSGNAITSTGGALDINLKTSSITLPVSGTVTANQGTPNTAANGWPVKVTDGTNTLSVTAAGEAKVDITQPLPAGSNNIGSVNQGTSPWVTSVNNLPTTVDTNYGTVGASTLRSAAQIGNATGAANFNNGVTGAQTLRTAANLAVAGADVTSINPVPVTVVSSTPGTPVNDYNTASAVAANATSNHDYSITSLKTFQGRLFWASASGKLKIEVQISPDGTTFTTKWVGFNSTATPNIAIDLDNLIISETGTGSKIRIIRTNEDKQAMDVYSTISGTEV